MKNTAVNTPSLLRSLRRIGATLIDLVLIVVIMYAWAALIELLFGEGKIATINVYLTILFGPSLYGAFHLSRSFQATLGQQAFGIMVLREDGERLSFWKAFGRTMAAQFLCIGVLLAIFDSKGQALHDKLTGSVVIKPT